jgi:hypothetical protein
MLTWVNEHTYVGRWKMTKRDIGSSAGGASQQVWALRGPKRLCEWAA